MTLPELLLTFYVMSFAAAVTSLLVQVAARRAWSAVSRKITSQYLGFKIVSTRSPSFKHDESPTMDEVDRTIKYLDPQPPKNRKT